MIHVLISTIFIAACYKWGDWKRWRTYYPTILFFMVGDLLYNVLFYDYPMWMFHDGPIPLFHYDVIISLLHMFTRYPATVILYLSLFPAGKVKGIVWGLTWIGVYSLIEVFDLYIGSISHHNGWSLWWSVFFNISIFLMLKIHHHKPLLAWGLSLMWTLLLWNMLDIPVSILK
ncbi:CBO0543 family protein [Salirhabdus salicampi]|uniref:CBO0543 family protein n=1 Tax=Salirhabdus salicampi TaxID=476102 RepID=UPI0020C26CEB|nr:CBO0543 family protein [Salirhabdus salicampi]MCP8615409.1 hypothetical protein [Salirhabdus salicampi]